MQQHLDLLDLYRADPTALRKQIERAARRSRSEALRCAAAWIRTTLSRMLCFLNGAQRLNYRPQGEPTHAPH
jgi:hypothetical protein